MIALQDMVKYWSKQKTYNLQAAASARFECIRDTHLARVRMFDGFLARAAEKKNAH